MAMAKVLFIASIELHILSFHMPFIGSLQQKGHVVHVATRLTEENKMNDGTVWHAVSFVRSPLSPANIKALFQLIRLMQREKYDLIHVHTPVAAFLGRLAAWWVGRCRVLYTVHGFHFYRGAPLLQWLLFYPAEKLARYWTDSILVMNREDMRQAKRLGYVSKHSLFFVPGVGVDLERYGIAEGESAIMETTSRNTVLGANVALGPNSIVFTCVAELIPRKNLSFLLQGWVQASVSLPNAHLCVVGAGIEEERLKKKIEEQEIKRVHLLGYRRDVPAILQATDVFILVSTQEGLPRGTLEAMAAGCPLIVSRIRGHVDLVEEGKNGLLVKTNDVDGLTEAIRSLGMSASLRRAMGEESKKRVALYSLAEVVRQMDEIYRLLLTKDGVFAK